MSTAASLPLPALVTAVCAALALSGCGGVSIDLGDVSERTETETVDIDGVERVRVETENGRVTVTGGAVDDVTVTARLRESDVGDADYTIRDDGSALVVEGHCDSGWLDECSVGFEITVPEQLAIEVATDNGRIDVSRVEGAIDVESDNGTITGEALGSSTLRARTDNGRIDLSFATTPARVTATTDNGAVAIRYPDDGVSHDVSTSSDNGSVDVDVRTDPTSDRAITVETDNGSIDVAYVR